jgi:hypothetical protein
MDVGYIMAWILEVAGNFSIVINISIPLLQRLFMPLQEFWMPR